MALKLGITMLIHNKDDIEFVTEFPCFFGTPCSICIYIDRCTSYPYMPSIFIYNISIFIWITRYLGSFEASFNHPLDVALIGPTWTCKKICRLRE